MALRSGFLGWHLPCGDDERRRYQGNIATRGTCLVISLHAVELTDSAFLIDVMHGRRAAESVGRLDNLWSQCGSCSVLQLLA